MSPNDSNPLGYWESQPIAEFHDRLFRAMTTSWDAWTPLNAAPPAATGELIGLITAEFGSASTFVVKDPRMCRLVPFWLSALEGSDIGPSAILIVRDPVEVARSLATRDGLPFEFSLLMWLRHMLDAEYATRSVPRSIVSYRELLTDWRAVARRVSSDLDIAWPCSLETAGEAISEFVKPEMRHHVSDAMDIHAGPPLDHWAMQVRDGLELLRCGEPVQAAAALAALDEVRGQVDAAGLIYGRADELVRGITTGRLDQTDADRQALRDWAAALEADRARLRDHVAALEVEQRQRAADREAELDRMERQAAALRAERDVLSERATHLSERATHLSEQASHLQAEHDRVVGDLASTQRHVQALLSSGSWRVTAPLRALLRAVRSATGRKDPPAAD
jgi:hypothetical protein